MVPSAILESSMPCVRSGPLSTVFSSLIAFPPPQPHRQRCTTRPADADVWLSIIDRSGLTSTPPLKGAIELPHGGLRGLGQDLPFGDQRPVHLGQKKTNVMLPAHGFCASGWPTGRQARAARASSSSAAFGPSAPES